MKTLQVLVDASIKEENHEIHFGTSRFSFEPSDINDVCGALDKSYKEVEHIESRIKEFINERREFGFEYPITIDRIAIRVTREDESVVGEIVINDKEELVLLPKLYELLLA